MQQLAMEQVAVAVEVVLITKMMELLAQQVLQESSILDEDTKEKNDAKFCRT
jgi:hypothetical protein